MNEPDEALRRLVATEYGLEPEAATFLAGSTLEEVEASAAKFAKVIVANREQTPEQQSEPSMDFITASRVEKQRRQRAFVDALRGRRQQPRDEQGRFKPSTGFDGGARRRSMPAKTDPIREHDRAVLTLAQHSKLGRSQF